MRAHADHYMINNRKKINEINPTLGYFSTGFTYTKVTFVAYSVIFFFAISLQLLENTSKRLVFSDSCRIGFKSNLSKQVHF